jgi:hypothetical protein
VHDKRLGLKAVEQLRKEERVLEVQVTPDPETEEPPVRAVDILTLPHRDLPSTSSTDSRAELEKDREIVITAVKPVLVARRIHQAMTPAEWRAFVSEIWQLDLEKRAKW